MDTTDGPGHFENFSQGGEELLILMGQYDQYPSAAAAGPLTRERLLLERKG